jgi:hypothetical protein
MGATQDAIVIATKVAITTTLRTRKPSTFTTPEETS